MAKAMGVLVIDIMAIRDRNVGITLGDRRSAPQRDTDNAQAAKREYENRQGDANDPSPHSRPRRTGTSTDRKPSPFPVAEHRKSIGDLGSLRLDPDQSP